MTHLTTLNPIIVFLIAWLLLHLVAQFQNLDPLKRQVVNVIIIVVAIILVLAASG